jgi:hypothetical protein
MSQVDGAQAIVRRRWPRRLGGGVVLAAVYAPIVAAIVSGVSATRLGVILTVLLLLFALAMWTLVMIAARAVGVRLADFRDRFPFEPIVYLWAIGTALVDAGNDLVDARRDSATASTSGSQ